LVIDSGAVLAVGYDQLCEVDPRSGAINFGSIIRLAPDKRALR
jgi:hypothetical protein